MSITSDFEVISQVVEQSEKRLCGEIAKLKKELNACQAKLKDQDETIEKMKQSQPKIEEHNAKIQTLEQKITVIENENKSLMETVNGFQAGSDHSGCRATMYQAFASALCSVAPNPQPDPMDMQINDISAIGQTVTVPMSSIELTSTPREQDICTQQSQPTNRPQEQRSLGCTVNLGKRKLPPSASETSCIYTEIESLPEGLRQRLEPFTKDSKSITRDKLNKVQQAFVRYKVSELKRTGGRNNDTFLDSVIIEGEKERIWPKNFKPSTELTFTQYLAQRVKNEEKKSLPEIQC